MVKLVKTSKPGGTVIISDAGDGMTDAEIVARLLLVGRSKKKEQRQDQLSAKNDSQNASRVPVGDKGLGRLAALRLGKNIQIETRPRSQEGKVYSLSIDWAKYDSADTVEQVELDIDSAKTELKPGTDIRIHNLRACLSQVEVDRLARELILLSDPFGSNSGFRAQLNAPEFKELEKKVSTSYIPDADFHLKGIVDKDGNGSFELFDWKGTPTQSVSGDALARFTKRKSKYKCPELSFELWAYRLNVTSFAAKSANLDEVRDWLGVAGGVHIYHRGVRVKPYGDPGQDWLEMNLARAKSPEERPSTNNSIGRILVNDPSDLLKQKTDRYGFQDNVPFLELKQFCQDGLKWMASSRLEQAEKRRGKTRVESSSKVQAARQGFYAKLKKDVPAPKRAEVEKAGKALEDAFKAQIKTLRDDLQLYRSLATAGTTSIVFAHQTGAAITTIGRLAGTIRTKASKFLGTLFEQFEKPLVTLSKTLDSLGVYCSLPIHLLKRDKRRSEAVDVHAVINELVTLLKPSLEVAQIKCQFKPAGSTPKVSGSISLVESIITNCILNSVNIFRQSGSRMTDRLIQVKTQTDEEALTITIADNGPGIKGLNTNEVWLPGRTTTQGEPALD